MPLTLAAIGVLYLALVLGLLWAVRRKRARERIRRQDATKAAVHPQPEADRLAYLKRSGLYWGVTLQTREGQPACPQAQPLLGQAFALDAAPRLPLAGCTLDCKCHYHPLIEQRQGKPRRVQHERRSNLRYEPGKRNRRQLPTRRD